MLQDEYAQGNSELETMYTAELVAAATAAALVPPMPIERERH